VSVPTPTDPLGRAYAEWTAEFTSFPGMSLPLLRWVFEDWQRVTAEPEDVTYASITTGGVPGIKVALCEATVPCGVVAAEVLAKAGVSVKATASEPDVKSVVAVVESGEVDAGVVYVTDVKAAGDKVVGVPIPDAQNATTGYPIAALKESRNAALATAFVDYVLSADGQQVLSAAGFRSP